MTASVFLSPTTPVLPYQIIDTKVASNSSIIEFTGLSSAYRQYIIVLQGIAPSTSGSGFYFQVGSVGGGYTTTNYIYLSETVGTTAAFTTDVTTTATELHITNGHAGINSSAEADYLTGQINIWGHASTTAPLTAFVQAMYYGEWSTNQYIDNAVKCRALNQGSSNTYTKIKFFMSADNIGAGTFELYGILA